MRTLSEALPASRVAPRHLAQWDQSSVGGDFAALRVTPATDWRHRRLAPEIWLLCERGLGPT